jgi:hypothetical protein
MSTCLIQVWHARWNQTLLVTEDEARAGMLRYAQTLGEGTAARACVEEQAREGDLRAFPQLRPAYLGEAASCP